MGIADYYLKAKKSVSEEIIQIAKEKANPEFRKIFDTEQFRFSLFGRNLQNTSKEEIHRVVDSLQDPVAQMKDVLRRKGYRPSEFRSAIFSIYYKENPNMGENEISYDEACRKVADMLERNPELYELLDPENLRNSKGEA